MSCAEGYMGWCVKSGTHHALLDICSLVVSEIISLDWALKKFNVHEVTVHSKKTYIPKIFSGLSDIYCAIFRLLSIFY